jgi:hypothetical protein
MSPVATDSADTASQAMPAGDAPASDALTRWRYPAIILACLLSGLVLWAVIMRYGDTGPTP